MTPSEWRPLAVERFGESSPAVRWLDKLAVRDKPIGALDVTIWNILGALDAGELEV